MAEKQYYLRADQIKQLVHGYGACLASDMITVEGRKVGYMYREPPDNDVDGGWRFMSGYETQEYVDDAKNLAYYHVNTIANYDPEIIPFLSAPIGAAFARDEEGGKFIAVGEYELPDDY
jgi:hypothetical protein